MPEYCEECRRRIGEQEATDNGGLCDSCFGDLVDEAMGEEEDESRVS